MTAITGTFSFTLKTSTGSKIEGRYENITPAQYGKIVSILAGNPASDRPSDASSSAVVGSEVDRPSGDNND